MFLSNFAVIIRLEYFEVKNQTIHINKYFIVSKEQQVIGDPVPIRQFSTLDPTIKPFSSPSSNLLCPYINEIPELHVEKNMDISLTEDHERLIDDFLKFTRDDTVREGTEDKAQLKSNLSALNKVSILIKKIMFFYRRFFSRYVGITAILKLVIFLIWILTSGHLKVKTDSDL